MGDRSGSLKLGSFKFLDVGGREPGCPGRGFILSDAALCSNVDCSQILLLPTSGRTAHDTKEVGSPKHLLNRRSKKEAYKCETHRRRKCRKGTVVPIQLIYLPEPIHYR